jgi:hypothetical protein
MRRLTALALPFLLLAPVLVGAGGALATEDDAGSGRDAPPTLTAEVALERARVYHGNATPIDVDVYALDVPSGARLEVAHSGGVCVRVFGPDLQAREGSCTLGLPGRVQRYEVDEHGTWFVEVQGTWMPGPYRLAYDVDRATPALMPVSVPPLPSVGDVAAAPDDAGSGRDAPSRAGPDAVPVEAGRAYDAGASSTSDADAYVFEGVAGRYVELSHTTTGRCWRLVDPDGRASDLDCILGGPVVTQYAWLDQDGAWTLVMPGPHLGAYRFSFGLQTVVAPLFGPEGNPRREAPEPWTGVAPPCVGDDATPTFGSGDPRVPTLRWGAFKEGGRVAVAWESNVGQTGELVYRVGDDEPQVVRHLVHQRAHAFVLDGLPVGETLCFMVVAGGGKSDWHELRLANAHRAYDDASGTYTLNLLVDATEAPLATGMLHVGLEDFARSLWDATDGHVRAGALMVLQGLPRETRPGFYACYNLAGALGTLDACHGAPDVVLTHDMWVLAAGLTRMDGIRDPRGAIFLDAALMTTLPLDDFGNVLLHEVGHYAFGMMDLYGGALVPETEGVTNPGCVDTRTGISVMDSDRSTTEFDDEVARCPNEAWIEGYVPSWTLLRERYPRIPERPGGPVRGPFGDGGVVDIGRVGLAPATNVAVPQDDAGSGRDAPDTPDGTLRIPLGVTLDATSVPMVDAWDHYAFHATAGQRLVATVRHPLCVARFVGPNGAVVEWDCRAVGLADTRTSAVATATGTWHLRIDTLVVAGPYTLRVDVAPPG